MDKKSIFFMSLFLFVSAALFAHTPILICYDNGNGTFTCEGGFSDGSTAEGVEIRIENPHAKNSKAKLLFKGVLDKNSELIVSYPKIKDFVIIFDAGPGHIVKVLSKDIEK